jgi:type II secretory pathway predicted ATPase ExeA
MYEAYWGLQKALFSAANARESLAASPVHAEALARLDFLRESRGPFGLLLGPAGSGKSTVLAEFAELAERGGALVAMVSAAGADDSTLLASLAAGLQVTAEENAVTIWRRIVDRLDELKLENLSVLALLDDLDRAAPAGLAVVERILAVRGAAVTIVATARPETARRMGLRLLDQAALRIDLNPWNEVEVREYLTASLNSAGRSKPVFDDAAARRLFELSGGAPRKVNQLAQLALLAGAGQKLAQIDRDTIDAVQEELSASR